MRYGTGHPDPSRKRDRVGRGLACITRHAVWARADGLSAVLFAQFSAKSSSGLLREDVFDFILLFSANLIIFLQTFSNENTNLTTHCIVILLRMELHSEKIFR